MNTSLKAHLLRHRRTYTLLRRTLLVGRWVLRRPHEDDFEGFAHLPGDGLFLDVGANSGASAMSFRIFKRRSPILSVEPSVGHAPDLRLVQRLVGNMRFLFAAAGEHAGVMDLHVPYYNGMPISEFASLVPSEVAESSWNVGRLLREPSADRSLFEIRHEQTAVLRLDDLQLAPDFVKIDVQGFELEVLKGLEQTLKEHQPVVLVEVSGNAEMLEWMDSRGYAPHEYVDGEFVASRNLKAQNMFMLPMSA